MIEVKDLSKRFDGLVVLDNVSFTVGEARLVVILGPSGTGKTVLLKSILGILPVDSGVVLFDGKSIQAAKENEIYDIRKHVGFVFQSTALFDSMNVGENIALPLVEHTKLSSRQIRDKVQETLEIVGMAGKERLYPGSLSGGMKRLVAVGRALALDPKYLFYDEPTTGLDPVMRDRIVQLIIDLKKDYKKSGIVVTHDLDTAEKVGDDIYLLKKGKISKLEQIKKEVYNG
jgi:phospholipid/cholesterol/gamma-HCH transport system ATP-binding protein